ncbi:hypothetical protein S40285_07859 [Stachybotrys chlorohalonatus IBT 40285]|uniref:Uncharacterized protein n=1 Tax=Stachybotrys chlorohalonatus (strain IBT 40285) TaxID=1283841 RepID=A0A084Q9H4_STAC4|nr:hypothetical protein S40285_07859 [Stachybotrys chlorohalonata IBT 40285]
MAEDHDNVALIDNPEQSILEAPKEYVEATDYATSWYCDELDVEEGFLTKKDYVKLRHVNCSYLSSAKAPTLLALKQHAQSLANLIKTLTVSDQFAKINKVKKTKPSDEVLSNQAFDWIVDLDTPYTNADEYHHLPLWKIHNHIRAEYSGETSTVQYHCPLHSVDDFGPLAAAGDTEKKRLPYKTHRNLLMHANECLEILDHDYSATGGLISILPTEHEDDRYQLAGARNTLVGQWLSQYQELAKRQHDFEIEVANSRDLLKGEAVVPMQLLSSAGIEGRAEGRQVAYPQDRFVLVNAGDDVFNKLHLALDEEEKEVHARDQGRAEGEEGGLRSLRLSQAKSTGNLVFVEAVSRFYRLKGQNKGTLFVLPYSDDHPGVGATRKLEMKPAAVIVPKATWPERGTISQEQHERELDELRTRLEKAEKAAKEGKKLVLGKKQGGADTAQAETEEVKSLKRELEEAKKTIWDFEVQETRRAEEARIKREKLERASKKRKFF